jgi:uncharacterized protein
VEHLKQYTIPFSGLSVGEHLYHYDIDEKFFVEYDYTEIDKANVSIDIKLDKQERMLVLDFDIQGTLNVMCHRCLDNFDYPIDVNQRLIVKFGDDWQEENEDIIIIPEHEHKFDVSNYIYEYIIVMLPFKITHPEDENGNSECNPEIIEKLKQLSESSPKETPWDGLKGLIMN